jgi:hypothetical protein
MRTLTSALAAASLLTTTANALEVVNRFNNPVGEEFFGRN